MKPPDAMTAIKCRQALAPLKEARAKLASTKWYGELSKIVQEVEAAAKVTYLTEE